MKKYILLLLLPVFFGCDKDSINNNNPYIPNYPVSLYIDLNLPGNNDLTFAGGKDIFYEQGALGVIVFNTGSGYNAFDAACPNQEMSSCSTMTFNGINALCPCDDAEYSLFTGISPGKQYRMKQYRVEKNGNVLHVYN